MKQNILGSSTSRHSYPHDSLSVGNAIQSLVHHDMTGDLLPEQPSTLEMEGNPDNSILVVLLSRHFYLGRTISLVKIVSRVLHSFLCGNAQYTRMAHYTVPTVHH